MEKKSFISSFVDRINREIRIADFRKMIIFGGVFLIIGIIFQILGGRPENIICLYIFPRSALSTPLMFILWGISFFYCGMLFACIAFGYEKYRRNVSYKCALMFALSQIFVFGIYPLFFGCASPFLAFLVLLISQIFCFFAIVCSIKIYSLWTVCLCVHFLWLIYNGYIALAFSIIN